MRAAILWTDVRNYFVALAVFLAIDLIWLGFIAKPFYAKHLGYLMAPRANLAAALVFYALYVLGLMVFVVNPALTRESWLAALLPGLLFGLVAYATYDLTNLATVKGWPLIVTAVDLIWGSLVSGTTSIISYLLVRLFKA